MMTTEYYKGKKVKYNRKTLNIHSKETLVINVYTEGGKLEALRIKVDSTQDGNVLIAMKSGMLSYEFSPQTMDKIMQQSIDDWS